jgi:hypothetical protein
MPSASSLVGGFVLAVIIMGLHLFLLSNDQANLLLPHLAGTTNDQLAEVYNTTIQQRLDEAFGNTTFGVISTAVVWGAAGLLVYTVADFIFSNIRDLRASNTNVAVPIKNEVIDHPLHRQIVIRLLWRFLIGIVLVVATLAFGPFISGLFQYDVALLGTDSVLEMLKLTAMSLGGWTLIFHVYVVLFRLFVLRTRVFGEIIY